MLNRIFTQQMFKEFSYSMFNNLLTIMEKYLKKYCLKKDFYKEVVDKLVNNYNMRKENIILIIPYLVH